MAEDLLRGLRPVGAVSYTGFHQDRDWAVKPDTLFCFDLPVPKDWEPRPVGRQCTNQNSGGLIGAQVDGEVESFEKITVDELIDRLVHDDDAWKPNVGLVLTDFAVRHGRVPADDAEYLDLIRALRNGRCAMFNYQESRHLPGLELLFQKQARYGDTAAADTPWGQKGPRRRLTHPIPVVHRDSTGRRQPSSRGEAHRGAARKRSSTRGPDASRTGTRRGVVVHARTAVNIVVKL